MRLGLVFHPLLILLLIVTLLLYIVALNVLLLRGSQTSVPRLTTLFAVVLTVLVLSSIILKVCSDGLLVAYMDT